MPRNDWGISASDIDDFDRSEVYAPYTGPQPPYGVTYQWRLKLLKFFSGDSRSKPQFWIGTELVPRPGRNEKKYNGYYVMTFLTISPNPKSRVFWVPFCDALGIQGRDTANTITDDEGNVKRIGRFRNNGDVQILGKLDQKEDGREGHEGEMRPYLSWFGALPEDVEDEEDDNDEFDDVDDELDEEIDIDEEDDDDDDEDEPEPPRRSASRRRAESVAKRSRGKGVQGRRRTVRGNDDDAF